MTQTLYIFVVGIFIS